MSGDVSQLQSQEESPQGGGSAPRGRRSAVLQLVVGLAVSLLTLWAFSRGVNLRQLGDTLRACDLRWLGGSAFLAAFLLVVRGWRWEALLGVYGIGYRGALNGVVLGTAANNVLPARAGELVRVSWMSAAYARPMAPLLVTAVVERILDLMAVAALAVWAAAQASLRPGGASFGWAAAAGGMALTATGGIAVLVAFAWSGQGSGARVLAFVPQRWRKRVEAVAGQVATAVFRDTPPRALLAAAWRTALTWGLAGVWVWVTVRALGLDLGWKASFIVLTAILAGIAIPSAPGFVGTYHLSAMLALQWLQQPQGESAAAAVLLHGVSYVVTTAWGAVLALVLAWQARSAARAGEGS